MDKEMEQFGRDLLQSVREMKAGKAARVTRVEVSEAASRAPAGRRFTVRVRQADRRQRAYPAGMGAGAARAHRRRSYAATRRRTASRSAARSVVSTCRSIG